jgi:dienelactone hydrolase
MHIEDIPYEADGRSLLGHLALDEKRTGMRPAVLVSHEGPGLNDHVKEVTEQLAEMGYIAFALDYQGNGEPPPIEEALVRMGDLIATPDRTAALAVAGFDVLLAQAAVDPGRVAAIGFCFGGQVSLELARTGADVKAVVGFHPGFTPDRVEASRNIKASVLLCSGAEDPFATAEQRSAFEVEMRDAGVADWRLEIYGGVGHSFTNPEADLVGMPGIAYSADAARRSWRSMLALLDETIGPV